MHMFIISVTYHDQNNVEPMLHGKLPFHIRWQYQYPVVFLGFDAVLRIRASD